MTDAQKKYKKEVKSKIITFYKYEKDLLNFANSINFQKFVKRELRKCMLSQVAGLNSYFMKDLKKWVTPRNSTALNSII